MADSAAWKSLLRRLWQGLRGLCGGEPAFPPPADPVLLNQVKGWFAKQLAKHPEIPVERRGEYARTAGVIFERMTKTALVRLVQNVREIRLFPDLENLTVALVHTSRTVASGLSAGRPIVGAYARTLRRLFLDGGDDVVED